MQPLPEAMTWVFFERGTNALPGGFTRLLQDAGRVPLAQAPRDESPFPALLRRMGSRWLGDGLREPCEHAYLLFGVHWLSDWQDVRCGGVFPSWPEEVMGQVHAQLAPILSDVGVRLLMRAPFLIAISSEPIEQALHDPYQMVGASMRAFLSRGGRQGGDQLTNTLSMSMHGLDLEINGVCFGRMPAIGQDGSSLEEHVWMSDAPFWQQGLASHGIKASPANAWAACAEDGRPLVWLIPPERPGARAYSDALDVAEALLHAYPRRPLVVRGVNDAVLYGMQASGWWARGMTRWRNRAALRQA